MLKIVYTNKMKRDAKRMKKRGKDMSKLIAALDLLASNTPMPEKYCDHRLKGEWKDYRECHIEPDWLLVYEIDDDMLYLYLTRTGTHSDLLE
jgi:mRNA interferase YafQ